MVSSVLATRMKGSRYLVWLTSLADWFRLSLCDHEKDALVAEEQLNIY